MSFGKFFRFFGTLILLGCAGCASLSQDGKPNYSAEQLRQMGESFLAAGDLGQALKYLTRAEEKRPDDPVIQYDLGLAYDERGLAPEALKHFQKAVALKPDYSEAHNALGRHYARQGQLDMALDSFKKALANPFYSTPHLALYNLGLLYEKKGDPHSALEQYQEAVRLQPNYGLAHYQIGLILEEFQRGDEARRAYGKAIEYSPDLVEAHLRYGAMSYTVGELEPAFYSLNRVVKLSPYSPMADEARKYLERLHSIIGNPSSRSSKRPSPEALARLEVVKDDDLTREETETASGTKMATGGQGRALGREPGTSAALARPEPEHESSAPSPWLYIVQVGTYVSQENAEAKLKKLERKGYKMIMKPFNHQVLGYVYVLQVKPVDNKKEAASLAARIESEENTKPVIIKIPAH